MSLYLSVSQPASKQLAVSSGEMTDEQREESNLSAQKASWKTLAATYVVGFGALFLASEPLLAVDDSRRNGSAECHCNAGRNSAYRGPLKRYIQSPK